MLVGSLELQVDLLMGSRVLCVDYVIVEGDGFVLIDASYVPLVSSTETDFSV